MVDPDPPSAATPAQRRAKAALAAILLLLGLWISATFLPAIAWAAIIAIAIDPLYQRAERRWPRVQAGLLPGIATLLIALLVIGPLALGLFEAAREAHALIGWFADIRANGLPEPAWLARMPMAGELSAWWQANLATPEGTAHQFHRFNSSMLITQSKLLGRGLIHRLVVFAFTLIALFFLLRDRDAIVRQLTIAGQRLLGASSERIGAQAILSLRGTIDGLVLVGIGEGVAMTFVYVIAGVPHPLLLGALTAVAAMIPFGAALLFAIASILLIGEGSPGWAIAVFAIGMVVVGIADHFVRPVLIGGATRLHFLWVLIGILGGVEMLGLLGLFVGPATMAILTLLWRDYVSGGSARSSSPAARPRPDYG